MTLYHVFNLISNFNQNALFKLNVIIISPMFSVGSFAVVFVFHQQEHAFPVLPMECLVPEDLSKHFFLFNEF